MSVFEKVEYVVDTFKFKGERGNWDILNEMFTAIQKEFDQDLSIEDWGIYDDTNGMTTIYNADSEPLLIVHYNTDQFVGAPNSIYEVIINEAVLHDMILTLPCPLCGSDGEMEYMPIDNPKSATTYKDKRATHMWVCDTCPAVLMEWYDDTDDKKVSERLNGKA